MAVAKEIRSKIRSIKNTQKITQAMEMVAASKMRKAQDRKDLSGPYSKSIRRVIARLARSHTEYRHPYLERREVKRAGFIVVSTDRGLCGGLNTNLLKTTLSALKTYEQQQVGIDLCLIGNKAQAFFKRFGGHVVAQASHLGDAPRVTDLVGLVKVMLDAYKEQQLDALFIVYNEFINTMMQRPRVLSLLPIVAEEAKETAGYWDYIYEPGARELLDLLLTRYIESQVYQSVIENIACEQAARMVAMKNATENASELISSLQLAYNKARQAWITQEITEIVVGASAV